MKTECQSCFTDVIPMGDGLCPSCGQLVAGECRNSNFQPAAGSVNQHPLGVLLDFVAGKYHQSVEVIVPLCISCRKAGGIEPKYIDFEAKSMTFVGHKAWKAEVLRLRGEGENA